MSSFQNGILGGETILIDTLAISEPIHHYNRFMSLYTGAGGMDIGFYRAGFRPIWSNDIDPDAVTTYQSVFGKQDSTIGDIREIGVPETANPDLVIGGPPCQGFSVAGKMDPNDPRSKHVFDFLGAVSRTQPLVYVMENVKALAANTRWSSLRDELIKCSREIGYETVLWLLNASHYDVPQARERMFLVGSRVGSIEKPIPVTIDNPPKVREWLQKLPPYGSVGNDSFCRAKITTARKPVLRRSPFAGMLFNGQGRPLNLDQPALTLPGSMGGNRTPIIDQRQLEEGGECWVIQYHQHLLDGGNPIDSVPSYLRRITVEEAAMLQTFPPGVSFHGKQSSKYRQIGNAVPPNLAYHVARAVRAALERYHERKTTAESDRNLQGVVAVARA